MLPAEPIRQELHRRLVAEGRMLPLPVVEDLDVLEAGSCPQKTFHATNPTHICAERYEFHLPIPQYRYPQLRQNRTGCQVWG